MRLRDHAGELAIASTLAKSIAIAAHAAGVIDVDFIFRSFRKRTRDLVDPRFVLQDIKAGMECFDRIAAFVPRLRH